MVNAVYLWGRARRHQGRLLLPIEDHDRGRSRDHFESAILDSLPQAIPLVGLGTGKPDRPWAAGPRPVFGELAVY